MPYYLTFNLFVSNKISLTNVSIIIIIYYPTMPLMSAYRSSIIYRISYVNCPGICPI